ncbi:MAG: zinc metallopeptidase, partial [Tetragenococcus sp.]|nr:zinc metallopeptidase [Tetragenococcus sp.]
MFPMGFFFGPTFILVIIGMVISMIASSHVNRTFERYDAVNSSHHITGTDAARYILRNQNIDDVGVQQISGN